MQLAHFGDVRKQLADGGDPVRRVLIAQQQGGHCLEKLFEVAEEEVILVAVVGVKRGASDVSSVEDLLHCDRVEGLLLDQGKEGVAQCIAGAADTAVDLDRKSTRLNS